VKKKAVNNNNNNNNTKFMKRHNAVRRLQRRYVISTHRIMTDGFMLSFIQCEPTPPSVSQ